MGNLEQGKGWAGDLWFPGQRLHINGDRQWIGLAALLGILPGADVNHHRLEAFLLEFQIPRPVAAGVSANAEVMGELSFRVGRAELVPGVEILLPRLGTCERRIENG